MFKKKRCENCGEKTNKEFNFCPFCRAPLNDGEMDSEDWGLLGKDDSISPDEIKIPMGLNSIFNTLLKSLNKQMSELENQSKKEVKKTKSPNAKKGGISISIVTSGNRPPEIKVSSFGNMNDKLSKDQATNKKAKKVKLPSPDTSKFIGLPKEEPETNVRRLSNKLIYEITIPGVKNIEDVSIIQLENSIEIKALGKEKAFHKIIPISYPIKNYNLSKGKLVLELDSRE